MQNQISFLFIVPTLNSSHLLNQLITSLKNQSYENWRLILIDGLSKQEHIKVLEDFTQQEERCSWTTQPANYKSIYGAMNYGISLAKENEWIIFWGSDDYAHSDKILNDVVELIKFSSDNNFEPDMLTLSGDYFDPLTKRIVRKSYFKKSHCKFMNSDTHFRRNMFLGSVPTHQATIFKESLFKVKNQYNENYKLAADLEYFLNLSRLKNKNIVNSNIDLVLISNGGVSGKKTLLRIWEVCRSYKNEFKYTWIIPFVFRYLKKILLKYLN